jgi:hypothetical protein
MNHYTLLALALAREQTLRAENDHLAIVARRTRPSGGRSVLVRRPLARGLAALSLGSAAIVRRLDECVADDLGRTLAPTE